MLHGLTRLWRRRDPLRLVGFGETLGTAWRPPTAMATALVPPFLAAQTISIAPTNTPARDARPADVRPAHSAAVATVSKGQGQGRGAGLQQERATLMSARALS